MERRDDVDIKLIHEVKKHECLYNPKCPQYKDYKYKQSIWEDIGRETDRPGFQAKKRWKYIRDSYKRKKEISPTDCCIRKAYKYTKSLRFLDDYSTNRISKVMISPALGDEEVSTDLSSDAEFPYEFSAKETEYSFETTLDDWDLLNSPIAACDSSSNLDLLNTDTNKNQICKAEEVVSSVKNNTNEEISFTSEEEVKEKDLAESIIYLVKKYECLYDSQSPQYKNFPHKMRLWHKIGKRVGLTGDDAKKRWKSLRDAYRKYRLKIITAEGFVSQYRYADALRFLGDFSAYKPCLKKVKNILPKTELTTSHDNLLTNSESISASAKEIANQSTLTSPLFQHLLNKINEANLTQQEQNEIEYAVSALVYSKLAEYNKNKIK